MTGAEVADVKRSPMPQRTTRLKADPVKVAAFNQRGRGKLKRGDWRQTNPPPRPSSSPGARGWTRRVFALYGDRCVVCGRKATEAHHAIGRAVIMAKASIPQAERAALEYDARNGVPVDRDCHAAHELAAARIPFDALPAGVVEWAIEHGFRSRIMDRRVYPLEPRP